MRNRGVCATVPCEGSRVSEGECEVPIEVRGGLYKFFSIKALSQELCEGLTHVVCCKPSSALCMAAASSGLKPVTPDWVTDSVKAGKLADEVLYHPR